MRTKGTRILRAKRQRAAKTTILQPRDLNADQPIASEATLLTSCDCSGVPQKFKYLESEITILDVIGSGDHAMVYRIAAGGRTFALKIHKYDNSAISLSGTPKPNIFFERERNAYNKLSQPSELPPASIPKYYGYINFTKPPQVNRAGKIPRKLFRSTIYRPAVYTDFLVDQVHDESIQKDPWRSYFMNKSGNCILQGVILDEIVAARHIYDNDTSNLNVARSGREGLKALHQRGILHGDVKNRLNTMITLSGDHVIWIDFSMSEEGDANIKGTSFRRKARREMREWDRYFEASIVGR
ncbi:hypothetical protein OCU04_012138 [Sclerotinia nivalis]|uniref:Protein kinase domain-containing protein n=1 Tax=Sclerotinia nivalis TaxID=352851 RepID=A0A9X0DDV7_9HELO|nr:hypothetical protein OCU04_012138 [Sclerotinia nivalis]